MIALGLIGLVLASTFILYRHANALSNLLEYPVWIASGLVFSTLNKPLATAYYLKEDLRRFWISRASDSRRHSSTTGSAGPGHRGSRCCNRWP